jgi:uncharacterized protein (DUF305 family)
MDLWCRTSRCRSALAMASALTLGSPLFALAQDAPGSSVVDQAQTASQENLGSEARYLAEVEAAMTKMMNDMATKPTGDIDRDFVMAMTPHHQGGIDMAVALLRYGHNEQLRRLAQEIIVTQQQEIAAMALAIGAPLPPSMVSPTQPPQHQSMSDGSMPMSNDVKTK